MQDYLKLLAAATIEAGLLCLLSRALFVAGFRVVGSRKHPHGGRLWHLLRLPGNLVHEVSHALVLALTGYRIEAISLSIFDAEGRGQVVARGRWHHLIPHWAAWGLAAFAPIVGSMLTIGLLMRPLGLSPNAHAVISSSMAQVFLARVADVVAGVNWHAWQGYVLLGLVLSLGSELAPSDRDVRGSLPGLLGAAAFACLIGAFFYAGPVSVEWRNSFDLAARHLLNGAIRAQELTLAVCGAASIFVLVPWVLRESLFENPRTENPRPVRPTPTRAPRRAIRQARDTRPRLAGRR
jgi:hypothetical protein